LGKIAQRTLSKAGLLGIELIDDLAEGLTDEMADEVMRAQYLFNRGII